MNTITVATGHLDADAFEAAVEAFELRINPAERVFIGKGDMRAALAAAVIEYLNEAEDLNRMSDPTTLPEGMIIVIKDLVRSYEGYCKQIEEMIVVRDALRAQIERLVPKAGMSATRLDDINPDPNVPMDLPVGIKPNTFPPPRRTSDGGSRVRLLRMRSAYHPLW